MSGYNRPQEKWIYETLSFFTDTVLFEYDYREDVMIITPNAKTMTGLNEFCVKGFAGRQDNPFICALQDQDGEKFLRVISNPPSNGEVKIFEIQVKGANGNLHWCICKIKALYESDSPGPIRLAGKLDDISALKEKETKLYLRSTRDGLTGLLNKTAFEYMVKEALKENKPGFLCMIDIDNFKDVNDRFGHQEGDGLLVYIGTMLNRIFGEDTLCGRVGGDEFMVFINGSSEQAAGIGQQANRLLNMVSAKGEEKAYHMSVSIGIALYRDGQVETYQRLFARADQAMYDAKQNGKNQLAYYEENVTEE